MTKRLCLLILVAGLGLPACSDSDDIIGALEDPQLLQDRIETMADCFPGIGEKLAALIDMARAWKQQNATAPAGLGYVVNGNVITATLGVANCTITMDITAHAPDGAIQGLPADPGTFDGLIDAVATQLGNDFGGQDPKPFMVGAWIIAGGGWSGIGAWTGIIGGSLNQNELENLITTANGVVGPPHAATNQVITDPNGCSLTFITGGILTDQIPGQEYPQGTITGALTNPISNTTVDFTVTADGTAIVSIVVQGIPGTYTFNLETLTLSTP